MNREFRYQILFSYYKELLTDKQINYLVMYYDNNLSLIEIANIENKSKESVFDLIKRVKEKLDKYEDKLLLYEKTILIEEILKKENVDEKIIKKIVNII